MASSFSGGLHAGQTFTLRPNESVHFEHAGGDKAATWHWRVVGS